MLLAGYRLGMKQNCATAPGATAVYGRCEAALAWASLRRETAMTACEVPRPRCPAPAPAALLSDLQRVAAVHSRVPRDASGEVRGGDGLLPAQSRRRCEAIMICPATVTKPAAWPSQRVVMFAVVRPSACSERRLGAAGCRGLRSPAVTRCQAGASRPPAARPRLDGPPRGIPLVRGRRDDAGQFRRGAGPERRGHGPPRPGHFARHRE